MKSAAETARDIDPDHRASGCENDVRFCLDQGERLLAIFGPCRSRRARATHPPAALSAARGASGSSSAISARGTTKVQCPASYGSASVARAPGVKASSETGRAARRARPGARGRWRGQRPRQRRGRLRRGRAPWSATVTTTDSPSRRADSVIAPPAAAGSDAMLDRVLDQRDQQVRRERMRAQSPADVDGEREPCADPRLQDVEIGFREIGFLAERCRARPQLRQRGAQIVDQVVRAAGSLPSDWFR